MTKFFFASLIIALPLLLAGCDSSINKTNNDQSIDTAASFGLMRKNFKTKLVRFNQTKEPVENPPKELFSVVEYESNIGKMSAYLSKFPDDKKNHPAIIWITGGFGNDIGDVWTKREADNDQSAAIFRKAGIIMMYPSQRGGNMNPGYDETCYGEIDDILSAADFLARQPGIDSNRIYLGGHSTGGTKALLAAECSKRFRAVFSFGPVASVEGYGDEYLTYDTAAGSNESAFRCPAIWLPSIQSPVYIFEGADEPGNISSLRLLEQTAKKGANRFTHFYGIKNKNHFSVLQPLSKIVAEKIIADSSEHEVQWNFDKEVEDFEDMR